MENLKPILKWTGGKRREIKHFKKYFPKFTTDSTYVEPFVGGGAIYFYLYNINGKNIINDFDSELINFYLQVQSNNEILNELKRISNIKEHNELEKEYYIQRNKDRNSGLLKLSETERAVRFFVVNQLAFSGMRRFNSDGEFNVPFGHYKRLNIKALLNSSYSYLLNKTEILNEDFENVITKNDNDNTFIFLDPPYTRVFKKYSHDNSFSEEDQIRLANVFDNLKKAKAMIIINKCELTCKLYEKFIKDTYSLKYGVNIKNRFNQETEHIIVCNYEL